MRSKNDRKMHNKGFTLTEVVMALLVGSMLMAASYMVFRSQQESYTAQDDIVYIQQNLRGVIIQMARELRMAGFGIPFSAALDNGVKVATSTTFSFDHDLDQNGVTDAGELITYGFSPAVDADLDGIPDAGFGDFGRVSGPGNNVFVGVAENIERVEFFYLMDDESTTLTPAVLPNRLNDIRAVTVSFLARADNPDTNYTSGQQIYTAGSGALWNTPADGFRRRLLVTTINLRNID